MKNFFIIMGLFCAFNLSAHGVENIYLQKEGQNPNNVYHSKTNRYYYSPYEYRQFNANNKNRLRRLRYFRELEKFNKRCYNNYLSWKNNLGTLTGFSPSITNDDLKNINSYPNEYYDTNTRPKNYSMEIFRTPKTNNSYYRRNGIYKNGDNGAVGKVGVTIIYD